MNQQPLPPVYNNEYMNKPENTTSSEKDFLDTLNFFLGLLNQGANQSIIRKQEAILLGQILTLDDKKRKEILKRVCKITTTEQNKDFLQELKNKLQTPQTQPRLGLI